MIHFSCFSCSKQHEAPDAEAGRRKICACGKLVTVPGAAVGLTGGSGEVGTVCDNCFKVFSAPAKSQVPCPKCGKLLKTSTVGEVKMAAVECSRPPVAPAPTPLSPAPAPAPVQPSNKLLQTSEDWGALISLVVIVASCAFVFVGVMSRVSEKPDSSSPRTPSYKPTPVGRIDQSSDEYRRAVRDQMIKQGVDPNDADEFTRELQKWEKRYPSP